MKVSLTWWTGMEVTKGQGWGHCREHFSFASDTLVATFPGSSPTLEVSSSRLEGKNESGTQRIGSVSQWQHSKRGSFYVCPFVPACPNLGSYWFFLKGGDPLIFIMLNPVVNYVFEHILDYRSLVVQTVCGHC